MVIFGVHCAPKGLHSPKYTRSGISNAPKMSFWVYTAPTQHALEFERPLGLAWPENRSRRPSRCCLGLARRMWRPLRLLATLAGLAAAPCPARPWPMTIDAISTEWQVKGGHIAAPGPEEGV